MKIEIDPEKCIEGCFTCFEVCPEIPDDILNKYKTYNEKEKLLEFFGSSNTSQEIINRCPKKAFEKTETENTYKIKKEDCINCKRCISRSNGPIINGKEKPVKCTLCSNQEEYKCIEACPYDALKLIYTEKERKKLEEKIGYRIKKEGEYEIKEENYSIQEAEVIEKTLQKIREENRQTEKEEIEAALEKKCMEINLKITQDHVEKLSKHIDREINGLSILEELLKDPELEEISIIGSKKPVYIYHKDEGWMKSNLEITNSEKIKNLINKSARKLNRRITLKEPRLNTNIEKGRIHGAIEPLATTGNCMTIRKFTANKFKPKDLVKNSTIPRELMNLLEKTVKCDTNILIAGNTGSGKTTTLNTLLNFLPKNERIIIVEETPEINPPQEHVIRLTTTPALDIEMHELVTDTLRMRPDRVIVGEVRNEKEAKALTNTMLAGQGKGSIATFHGNSAKEAITRLKSLGIDENDLIAIDLILVQRRWMNYQNKKGKEIRKVTEAAVVKKRNIETHKIYTKEKGLLTEKLKSTELIKKLEMSYGETKEKIIKNMKR